MSESAEAIQTVGQDAYGAWPRWGRVGFRFAFCFWVLSFLAHGPLSELFEFSPWLSSHIDAVLTSPLNELSLWVGLYVFRLKDVVVGGGQSMDSVSGWIGGLCLLVMSLSGCAVWSVISARRGRRLEYRTLFAWLLLGLRFWLAMEMFSYGFAKIFPQQFHSLTVEELQGSFGASSPMGLLWRFMGFSTAYRVFGGVAEVVPGFLLLFRRTSTVGVLAIIAVMTNVVMLNLCFDVPVKHHSIELFLLAVFLLLPDLPALWRFFFKRGPAHLTGVWVEPVERGSMRIFAHVMKAIVIASFLYATAFTIWKRETTVPQALAGRWAVDAVDGPDDMHWQAMTIQTWAYSGILAGKVDKQSFLRVRFLAKPQVLQFLRKDGEADSLKTFAELHWVFVDTDHLLLTGKWQGQAAHVSMHRLPLPHFLLTERGFRWVQPYGLNK